MIKAVPILFQLAGGVLLAAGVYIKFGFEFGYMTLGVFLLIWGTVAEATARPKPPNGKPVLLRRKGGE